MTEEEKIIFNKDLKRVKRFFIVALIVIVIILGLLQKCNNDSTLKLKGEYKQLEKQYKDQKVKVVSLENERLKQKDSLNSEITRRELANIKLNESNNKLEDKISSIKNRDINLPKDIQGLVSYYNDRYKTKDNKVIEDKVGLTNIVAYEVSHELEQKDKFEEIIPLKDEQLMNKDFQISNLEKDKEDIKTKLLSAENSIEEQNKLQEIAQQNINNLKSQVQKSKSKFNINKILIPASIIVGGFIGYEIAK